MNRPTRYGVVTTWKNDCTERIGSHIEERPDGIYVLADDYDHIEAENKRLRDGFTGTLVAGDVQERTITLSVPFETFRDGEIVTGKQYSISAALDVTEDKTDG